MVLSGILVLDCFIWGLCVYIKWGVEKNVGVRIDGWIKELVFFRYYGNNIYMNSEIFL